MSEPTVAEETGPTPWPLHDQLVKLQSYDPQEIVGLTRMGAGMSFDGCEQQVAELAKQVDDVRLDWSRLSSKKQSEITTHVDKVLTVVDQMLAMDSGRIDKSNTTGIYSADQVRQHREGLVSSLSKEVTWFNENVRPVSVMAPARDQAEEVFRSMSTTITPAELNDLKQTFAELRDQAAEFERMKPLVEAQRELLGESGTAKLSADLDAERAQHEKAWKFWLAILLCSVAALVVGGTVFVSETRPAKDATNAQTATHIFTDLLVIGLAIFVVRIFSLQFRAHRHMEIVTQNKANALTTFNRMVAGQPDEVRTVIAAALAQSVFGVDESIFADSSSEHVTILERVLSPGIDRLRTGG